MFVPETKRRCGFFLDVFGLTLPEYLDCELFPESEDGDVCVGHKEVIEAENRAQKPGMCHNTVTNIECVNGNCLKLFPNLIWRGRPGRILTGFEFKGRRVNLLIC